MSSDKSQNALRTDPRAYRGSLRPAGKGQIAAAVDCGVDQRRQVPGACFSANRGAMVFDGALADAEIGGDVLARVARDHEVHDLVLPLGQRGDACGNTRSWTS